MKKTLTILGLVLITATALAAKPKKVFVSNLQPRNIEKAAVETIDMAVCNAAHQDKRFDVTCPEEVKSVMAFDSMNAMLGAAPSCEGDDCAARLAKRVQAKIMITGSVAKLADGKYTLTLEALETDTAKNLGRVEEQVIGDQEAVFTRAKGAVKKLLDKIK